MKKCPACTFVNEERFPTCVWCNASLTQVKSTPSPDPGHPEHAASKLVRERQTRRRSQFSFAIFCYATAVTGLAVVPGLIFDLKILFFFTLTACATGFACTRAWLGQFSAMFVQGAFSAFLTVHFGQFGYLTGFMLVGHVISPAIFSQWAALIDEGHA